MSTSNRNELAGDFLNGHRIWAVKDLAEDFDQAPSTIREALRIVGAKPVLDTGVDQLYGIETKRAMEKYFTGVVVTACHTLQNLQEISGASIERIEAAVDAVRATGHLVYSADEADRILKHLKRT